MGILPNPGFVGVRIFGHGGGEGSRLFFSIHPFFFFEFVLTAFHEKNSRPEPSAHFLLTFEMLELEARGGGNAISTIWI